MTTTIHTAAFVADLLPGVKDKYLVRIKDLLGNTGDVVGIISLYGTHKVPLFEQTAPMKICRVTAQEIEKLLYTVERTQRFIDMTIEVDATQVKASAQRIINKFLSWKV